MGTARARAATRARGKRLLPSTASRTSWVLWCVWFFCSCCCDCCCCCCCCFEGLALEGFVLFFWLVLLVALSACLLFSLFIFWKVTETSRGAFFPGRVHLALLRQAGLQITATCVDNSYMCCGRGEPGRNVQPLALAAVSLMGTTKSQQHYFGGLVIGQSSKIMLLRFWRAGKEWQWFAVPCKSNQNSMYTFVLEHWLGNLNSKPKKKQEHYFGALTNDQCSKIKFLFCLAALFWKLQKGDAP